MREEYPQLAITMLYIGLAVGAVAAIVVGCWLARKRNHVCRGVDIKVTDNHGREILHMDSVQAYFAAKYGGQKVKGYVDVLSITNAAGTYNTISIWMKPVQVTHDSHAIAGQ